MMKFCSNTESRQCTKVGLWWAEITFNVVPKVWLTSPKVPVWVRSTFNSCGFSGQLWWRQFFFRSIVATATAFHHILRQRAIRDAVTRRIINLPLCCLFTFWLLRVSLLLRWSSKAVFARTPYLVKMADDREMTIKNKLQVFPNTPSVVRMGWVRINLSSDVVFMGKCKCQRRFEITLGKWIALKCL